MFNSSNLFLAEREEMKSCVIRVEITNIGVGLQLCWHHLLVLLFDKTVLFTFKRVCKVHFMTKLCNHYPMLTLHIAGLRVDNSKSVISEN